MSNEPIAEGRRWLEQARHDLRWAADLAERGGYHIACFLAQQVAEKAFKASLYACGDEAVLGHSVQRLGADAVARDAAFAEPARRWAALDGYYIPTRYPNGWPDSIPALVFSREAAVSAVPLAREAVEMVADRIEALNGPATADSGINRRTRLIDRPTGSHTLNHRFPRPRSWRGVRSHWRVAVPGTIPGGTLSRHAPPFLNLSTGRRLPARR
jgi:HEPN domain-containing protein